LSGLGWGCGDRFLGFGFGFGLGRGDVGTGCSVKSILVGMSDGTVDGMSDTTTLCGTSDGILVVGIGSIDIIGFDVPINGDGWLVDTIIIGVGILVVDNNDGTNDDGAIVIVALGVGCIVSITIAGDGVVITNDGWIVVGDGSILGDSVLGDIVLISIDGFTVIDGCTIVGIGGFVMILNEGLDVIDGWNVVDVGCIVVGIMESISIGTNVGIFDGIVVMNGLVLGLVLGISDSINIGTVLGISTICEGTILGISGGNIIDGVILGWSDKFGSINGWLDDTMDGTSLILSGDNVGDVGTGNGNRLDDSTRSNVIKYSVVSCVVLYFKNSIITSW
jgi:hypothetical protein